MLADAYYQWSFHLGWFVGGSIYILLTQPSCDQTHTFGRWLRLRVQSGHRKEKSSLTLAGLWPWPHSLTKWANQPWSSENIMCWLNQSIRTCKRSAIQMFLPWSPMFINIVWEAHIQILFHLLLSFPHCTADQGLEVRRFSFVAL